MALPEVPGAELPPPGVPDVATLTRLASAFFATLPGAAPTADGQVPAAGGVPVPAHPHPPGLSLPPGAAGPATPAAAWPDGPLPGANLAPQTPRHLADAGAQVPKLRPHAQAPNGLPELLPVAAPGYHGRLGGQTLGVPPGHDAHLPGRPGGAGVPGVPGVPRMQPSWRDATGADPDAASVSPSAAFYFLPEGAAGGSPVASSGPGFYFLEPVPTVPAAARQPFDVHAIRRDFPILRERVHGRPLVWFDNAATTQKPQVVIDRIARFYTHENSNIHRAAHELAARATDAYEHAREVVRRFIGAGSVDEIIFVRGTTEAINLVARSWGAAHIGEGDEIVLSHLEHHANIVPWQLLAAEKGARIRVIPVDDDGQVLLDEYQKLLNDRTKIVSVTQVSNALGTVVPVQQIVDIARRRGIRTLVDGAQSVSHMRVDVRALDTDFFVFSGHKIFGPTGIGVVYGRKTVLDAMPPWQGGGNMIADVTFEKTVYHGPPTRFEAGTGNIADAVGLAAALEYVERIGIEPIGAYEHALLEYATARLKPIPGVRLVGTAADKASVLSFVLDGTTTDDVGKALNQEGIAVRTGHHCAQPILRRFGLEATVRPSLAFYNTCEEVDRFIAVVQRLSAARRRPGPRGAR